MARTIDGGGNLAAFRDIHGVVDGKLYKYGIRTRFSLTDKQKIIGSLIDLVEERGNANIKKYGILGLQIIRQDAGKAPNWHGSDGVFADDVVVEICDLLSECQDNEIIDTVINHLCEQMSDMIRTNGTCPTGRSGRVFQIYSFLRDFRDGVHKSRSA